MASNVNGVCTDDWTAKRAIIASNVASEFSTSPMYNPYSLKLSIQIVQSKMNLADTEIRR